MFECATVQVCVCDVASVSVRSGVSAAVVFYEFCCMFICFVVSLASAAIVWWWCFCWRVLVFHEFLCWCFCSISRWRAPPPGHVMRSTLRYCCVCSRVPQQLYVVRLVPSICLHPISNCFHIFCYNFGYACMLRTAG